MRSTLASIASRLRRDAPACRLVPAWRADSRRRIPSRWRAGVVAIAGLLLAMPMSLAAAELKPWAGGSTPALSLPLLDGGRFDLTALRGKVVLVNFWATWCAPCIREMPALEKLARTLPADRFTVIAVNYGETGERIRAFLARVPIGLPIALDSDLAAGRAWGAKVLPVSFVVDRDGGIRYSALGDPGWNSPAVVAALARLAGGSADGAFGVRADSR